MTAGYKCQALMVQLMIPGAAPPWPNPGSLGFRFLEILGFRV